MADERLNIRFHFTIEDIARWFGVPIRLLAKSAWSSRHLRRSYRNDPERLRARRIRTRPAKWRARGA